MLEVLDMHDGDEERAKEAIIAAVNRLIEHRGKHVDLSDFDHAVDAAFFASSRWWQIGLARLRELGKISAAA